MVSCLAHLNPSSTFSIAPILTSMMGLRDAEDFLLSKQNDSLVTATFVRPGAPSHDTQKGHYLSLEKAEMPLSFLDLTVGMLEIAQDE